MCHGCHPGLNRLAQTLMSDVASSDFTQINQAPPANDPPAGTTIFTNGSIITMAGGNFSPVEALAISGGAITATGSLQQVQQSVQGGTTTTVDLQGKCILPGFIEPHLHLFLSALTIDFLIPLQPWTVPTQQYALKILKSAAEKAEQQGSPWVAAYGYDPSLIQDHLALDADTLDQNVSTTIGVFVLNQSGHIAYVNHKAFALANINNSTPNPTGGTFVRKDGNLTGVVLEGPAIDMVSNRIPKPDPAKFIADCAQKLNEWSANGCTTVFDAGIGTTNQAADVTILQALTTQIAMPMRFVGAVASAIAQEAFGDQVPPITVGTAQVQAIKFWADGSTQGFTAALNEPYLGEPNTRGTLNYANDADLQAPMNTWMGKGWQLSIHANGDRAVDQSLRCYDAVFQQLPTRNKNIMHRIEHFTVSRPDQVQTAVNLGLGVSHTIGHVYYWGETFLNYVLGTPRAERIDPVQDDVNAGLVYSFHSDSPLTEPDPLLFIRTAVTRLMYNTNTVLGGDQCVTLEEALRGVTVNPAKQLNMWDSIGSLEVGKSADLVILGQDPQTVAKEDLNTIPIYQTWYKGSVVFDASATK